MKKKLNVKLMKRLFKFGGLRAYNVSYFCPILFRIREICTTFDEQKANSEYEKAVKEGFAASVDVGIIQFHEAFQEKR